MVVLFGRGPSYDIDGLVIKRDRYFVPIVLVVASLKL